MFCKKVLHSLVAFMDDMKKIKSKIETHTVSIYIMGQTLFIWGILAHKT